MAFFTSEEIIILLDLNNLSTNQETALNLIISASEKRMKNYCNRGFEEETSTETYDGNGKYYLNVDRFPITSAVADIVITIGDDDAIDTTDDDIFKINNSIGKMYVSSGFTSGFQNVSITYKAGYTSDDLPDDLKAALLILIQSNYNKMQENSADVTEYEIGDIVKKYQFSDIPILARLTFDSYRKINI